VAQAHAKTNRGNGTTRAPSKPTPNVAIFCTSSLATSGIYTQNDLDALRDHVMFPAEKTAVLNTIARGAAGKAIVPGTVNVLVIMDETTLTAIAKNAASKLWNGFIEFGTFSALILGIFIILKIIKTIVGIVIHGYQLRETYGMWNRSRLGAICGSVTHLLLYIKGKRNVEDQTQPQGISITSNDILDQQPTPTTSALNELEDTISQISSGNVNFKRGSEI
jgi:hypothetical protein